MEARATIAWETDALSFIESRVRLAMQTGKVSLGESTEEVERLWPKEGGPRNAIVVSNGTTALELVWKQLQLDYVITPEMTVPMVRWAANRSGAMVTSVDVDDHLCLDIDKTDELIARVRRTTSVRTARLGVCYVSTAGLMSPKATEAFTRWRSQGIKVVIDMSHAHGGSYNGYPLYQFGDAATWSFYATKILTSGEGGIAWFADDKDASRARILANQGKKRGSGVFETEGFAYRLSEFASAAMLYEVLNAERIYAKRRSIAAGYEALGVPGLHQAVPKLGLSFYKYVVPLSATKYEPGQADLVEQAFKSLGVHCTGRVHGISDNGGTPWTGEKSKFWATNHVCLPIGRNMSPEMVATVGEAWKQIRRTQ